MNWKNTTEDIIVKDSTMDSQLKVQEIIIDSTGKNAINFQVENHSSIVDVALNKEDVQNLMEKLNIWLKTQ